METRREVFAVRPATFGLFELDMVARTAKLLVFFMLLFAGACQTRAISQPSDDAELTIGPIIQRMQQAIVTKEAYSPSFMEPANLKSFFDADIIELTEPEFLKEGEHSVILQGLTSLVIKYHKSAASLVLPEFVVSTSQGLSGGKTLLFGARLYSEDFSIDVRQFMKIIKHQLIIVKPPFSLTHPRVFTTSKTDTNGNATLEGSLNIGNQREDVYVETFSDGRVYYLRFKVTGP